MKLASKFNSINFVNFILLSIPHHFLTLHCVLQKMLASTVVHNSSLVCVASFSEHRCWVFQSLHSPLNALAVKNFENIWATGNLRLFKNHFQIIFPFFSHLLPEKVCICMYGTSIAYESLECLYFICHLSQVLLKFHYASPVYLRQP